jgi:peptide-methionine (R)-S-oxide reductase
MEEIMERRIFLRNTAALAVFGSLFGRNANVQAAGVKSAAELQKNWKKLLADGFKAPSPTEPFKLSKEEWRKRLTAQQFNVLREEGTERSGTSALNGEKRPGVFVCAGCDLPVFTSEMKYESGTGWPSFFTTIPGAFGKSTDYKMVLPRTEYHCIRCGGHHGHIFSDGPNPTRQRWCNNGVALKFIPKTGKA